MTLLAVKRSRVAWLLSLPLSAAGMLLAHEVAWGFASHEHQAGAGHGYLQYGAVFAALAVATLLVAATAHLVRSVRGDDVARAPSARVFAVVPVLGFLLQEHLEHLVVARELEIGFFVSTPFVLGLALQLPFAFAALVVARFILGVVHGMGRALRTIFTLEAPEPFRAVAPLTIDLPLRPALALRRAGRAPPRLR